MAEKSSYQTYRIQVSISSSVGDSAAMSRNNGGSEVIAIDGLAEVVLNVHDPARSLAFYQELLGLERISPAGQSGPIFLRAGSATSSVPALVVLVPLPVGTNDFTLPRALHHLALTI